MITATEIQARMETFAAEQALLRSQIVALQIATDDVETKVGLISAGERRPYHADQYVGPFAVRAVTTLVKNDYLQVGAGYIYAGITAYCYFPNDYQAGTTPWPVANPDLIDVSVLGPGNYLALMTIDVNPSTGVFDATYIPTFGYCAAAAYNQQTAASGVIVLAEFTVANGVCTRILQRQKSDIYVPVTHDTTNGASTVYAASWEISGKMA